MRPILDFWGLPVNGEGLRRLNRGTAIVLLIFCSCSSVVLLFRYVALS